jgi:hypothetical protein
MDPGPGLGLAAIERREFGRRFLEARLVGWKNRERSFILKRCSSPLNHHVQSRDILRTVVDSGVEAFTRSAHWHCTCANHRTAAPSHRYPYPSYGDLPDAASKGAATKVPPSRDFSQRNCETQATSAHIVTLLSYPNGIRVKPNRICA